jgi:hypothetical protein
MALILSLPIYANVTDRVRAVRLRERPPEFLAGSLIERHYRWLNSRDGAMTALASALIGMSVIVGSCIAYRRRNLP